MDMKAAASTTLREIDDLPGPRSWPFFGSLLAVDAPRIHQNVEAWARTYGPYFRLRLGRYTLLVVADHEAYRRSAARPPRGLPAHPEAGAHQRRARHPARGLQRRGRRLAATSAAVVMAGFAPAPPEGLLPFAGEGDAAARGTLASSAAASGTPIDAAGRPDALHRRRDLPASPSATTSTRWSRTTTSSSATSTRSSRRSRAGMIAPVATWRYREDAAPTASSTAAWPP